MHYTCTLTNFTVATEEHGCEQLTWCRCPKAWRLASNVVFSNGLLDPWCHGGVSISSVLSNTAQQVLKLGPWFSDLRHWYWYWKDSTSTWTTDTDTCTVIVLDLVALGHNMWLYIMSDIAPQMLGGGTTVHIVSTGF